MPSCAYAHNVFVVLCICIVSMRSVIYSARSSMNAECYRWFNLAYDQAKLPKFSSLN